MSVSRRSVMRSYYATGGTVPPPSLTRRHSLVSSRCTCTSTNSSWRNRRTSCQDDYPRLKNDAVPETPCPPLDAFRTPAGVTVTATITLAGTSLGKNFNFFLTSVLWFFSLSRNRNDRDFEFFSLHENFINFTNFITSRPLWSEVHEVIDNSVMEFAEVKFVKLSKLHEVSPESSWTSRVP